MDMVEEVAALAAPDRSVLLVVDVQNDFCHADGFFGRAGVDLSAIQAAAERIVGLIDVARRAGVPVVFVATEHGRWTNTPAWVGRATRAARPGEICAPGSSGAGFYRVAPGADDCVVIKHRYSAFLGTRLEVVLRALGRPTLVVCGVTTNVCVETTVRDGFMRDYQVFLVEDCAGAPTKDEHASAVHNVRTYFGRVTDTRQLADLWSRAAR